MRLIDADAIVFTHAIARSIDDGHNWNELCVTKDEVDDMPSAEQERKKGKWIDVKINSYTSRTCCSECGSSAPFIYKSDDYYSNHAHGETARTKFCPNCGADLRL